MPLDRRGKRQLHVVRTWPEVELLLGVLDGLRWIMAMLLFRWIMAMLL